MQAINPTTTSAWSKLVELSKKHQTSTITALFDQKNRFERYSRSLEDILVDFSKNRISDEVFEELLNLAREVRTAAERGEKLKMTEEEIAFYDALANNESAVKAMGDDKLKVIAAELVTKVRQSTTIDWTMRESARAAIRVMVKRILRQYGYPPDFQDAAVQTILLQAELLCKDWAA
jgi:type I restriction enzyme R subunit